MPLVPEARGVSKAETLPQDLLTES